MARCLRGLPDTRAAFAQGTVSYSKVRALTRVATADNEDYYLMIARHGTAAHMEKVVRGVRRVQRQRELAEANARHDERTLYWHYDDDGMLVVRARLDPEQGARFMAAVNTAMEALISERAHDGAGDVSAETAECLWDGWPMDEAQAVENALTPEELATF